MDEAEKHQHFKLIDEMSQIEMAKLWRFAPNDHPYFDERLPFYEKFKKRFDELGGMTPVISKSIGWGGSD